MADTNLTQAIADELIAMEKHRANEDSHAFPMGGESLAIPLQSHDKREMFLLDLSRGRIDLAKVKMQNRARQVVILVRVDIAGAPHRNPDGVDVPCPHMHVYREGYGDKWAAPIPTDRFTDPSDIWTTFRQFMAFCNITQPPNIERGLFT
jgi:hypothetical protein